MRLAIATCFVAFTGTVAAQTFTALPPIADPLTRSLLAGAELVGPITATPGADDDAMLFRVRVGWRNVVYLGRVHPSKSGPLGVYTRPGLCLESSVAFAFVPDTITATDINGDGIDDLIGKNATETQVLLGHGLSACR